MDDLRIGPVDFVGSHSDAANDGSKKRLRQQHAEPEEEPVDEVMLSSTGDDEEQPRGYSPAGPDVER
jgi:hypothetical protein